MTWYLIIILAGQTISTPYGDDFTCYEALEAMRIGGNSEVVAYCQPEGK